MSEREIVERLRAKTRRVPAGAILSKDIPDEVSQEAADAIERLSGELTAALKRCADYAREAGEWKGRYDAAGYPGTLDGWIARAEKAEREMNEAVEALKPFADAIPKSTYSWAEVSDDWWGPSVRVGAFRAARAFIAKMEGK